MKPIIVGSAIRGSSAGRHCVKGSTYKGFVNHATVLKSYSLCLVLALIQGTDRNMVSFPCKEESNKDIISGFLCYYFNVVIIATLVFQ
jgi:hypothetical protein